jgi:hypothetical protein
LIDSLACRYVALAVGGDGKFASLLLEIEKEGPLIEGGAVIQVEVTRGDVTATRSRVRLAEDHELEGLLHGVG